MSNRIYEKRLLNGVTSSGAGDAWPSSKYKGWNFIFLGSSVTTGATIDIEVEVADGDWAPIHTETITADGYKIVQSERGHFRKLRANITSYTDGTYYVFAQGSWVA